MVEKLVKAEPNEAFGRLKSSLIKNKCRIIDEEAPNSVSTIQGSLWGTSPKTAQKKTKYTLRQDVQGTQIASTSRLTTGYVNLTLSGVALSIGLMFLCVWIALNLQAYSSGGAQGFWGWIVQVHGSLDSDVASLFIWLSWILAAFLVATLMVEGVVVARVRSGIDAFAAEILETL